MNEIDYLRHQVHLERDHLLEVRAALSVRLSGSDPDDIDQGTLAAAPYLLYALQRLADRDALHCERLRARLATAPGAPRADWARISEALAEWRRTLADLRDACTRFEAAFRQHSTGLLETSRWVDACREFDSRLETTMARRPTSLETWLDAYYTLADWRSAALVDAEAVLEERSMYSTALAALLPSTGSVARG